MSSEPSTRRPCRAFALLEPRCAPESHSKEPLRRWPRSPSGLTSRTVMPSTKRSDSDGAPEGSYPGAVKPTRPSGGGRTTSPDGFERSLCKELPVSFGDTRPHRRACLHTGRPSIAGQVTRSLIPPNQGCAVASSPLPRPGERPLALLPPRRAWARRLSFPRPRWRWSILGGCADEGTPGRGGSEETSRQGRPSFTLVVSCGASVG